MKNVKRFFFGTVWIALLCANSDSFSQSGIWISSGEIAALPTSGAAWNQIKSIADSDFGQAKGGHNDKHDTNTLAQAYVAARLGLEGAGVSYRERAADNIMSAIGSENNGNALSLGRNLPSYVIAADVIDFASFDPAREVAFRKWISNVRYKVLDSRWIIEASENRPNNWGLMTLAARIAVATYLKKYGVPADACQGLPEPCTDPETEIERVAQIFKGWLGDRSSYSGFKYGSLAWQLNPDQPIGINPKGATKDGRNIDGVLPDDQRRGGGFNWPPPKEGYVYEGLQAVLVTAEILSRQGYDVWNWQDRAILRAYQWLHTPHFKGGGTYEAQGDDTWQLSLVNYHYGTDFPAPVPSTAGKNMGWTDWTHGNGNGDQTQLARIDGKVENQHTAQPVFQANLQLKNGDSIRYRTQSDVSGFYHFIGITPGSYTLICKKDGFEDWIGSVTVNEGQQISGQNILLSPTMDATAPSPPKNVKVSEEGSE
ncbi:MAG: carboxypeptidase regulatory-like domain-containing protein [bacterium]